MKEKIFNHGEHGEHRAKPRARFSPFAKESPIPFANFFQVFAVFAVFAVFNSLHAIALGAAAWHSHEDLVNSKKPFAHEMHENHERHYFALCPSRFYHTRQDIFAGVTRSRVSCISWTALLWLCAIALDAAAACRRRAANAGTFHPAR